LVPETLPNPRLIAAIGTLAERRRIQPICRQKLVYERHDQLLAMQKVEGSSPFIRSSSL
jgi:hypothetical protein